MEDSEEIQRIILEIMENKRNGWWYMFLVLSLISYNRDNNEYEGKNISWNELKLYFKQTLDYIEHIIQVRLLAQMDSCVMFADGKESVIMKNIVVLLKQKQLYSFSENKDMRWTNGKFQELYRYNSSRLLAFIRENIGCDMEKGQAENIDQIASNLVEVLGDTGVNNANIKSYIEEINLQLEKMSIPPLDLDITGKTKITVQDVMSQIENKKEGVDYE